ncbi:Homeobox-leucine zipper protein ATHB-15 [Cinnamomum micranthum f. kanehirae]|uniref:Homeobox-leucine zipper protein ATHB-15 n=1 Tax=Cinnamomum micranthum f. kanehirae TaxID=337451 RepID=A0A3S3NZF9_9MAGN|nr:Homeobox-leucine zipper protein ATHB-15 [Cinnamomum micranthum f. kanehirae]
MAVTSCKEVKSGMDPGKYVRYTPEQVEALERLYHECPKPSSVRRQQVIRECPILSNIEPKQIKVWFQNRRCREKQRKEASRLHGVNRKLTAMNKLLMEENHRLQKQVSQLVYENGYFRQQTQNTTLATTDTSCESVVTNGQHHLTPQHPPRDASPAGLLSIAEETLTEFLSKATGTAVEWVQMPGMKPGPDSIGIVAISHGCTGVAARACGLVGLEPTRVTEILKDRPSWLRDCRSVDVVNVLPTGNGGTLELLYMQLYAPTTLAPARDFWLLRYTSLLEDGSLVVCERSLSSTQGGPSMPPAQNFVRAEMLPSGYLIRPCEGGGSIIHIVDHMDLEPSSVPEVLRPLYESSAVLAQKTTMAALRQLRQIAQEVSPSTVTAWGRRPAALRALGHRLSRGFNEALNGFTDEGWTIMGNDGIDDVTILTNSSPSKMTDVTFADGFSSISSAVLCAKASMLLQNVPPAVLLRFLREHRSEWADSSIDAYSAGAAKANPSGLPASQIVGFGGQVILPLAHTIEHEEPGPDSIGIVAISHGCTGVAARACGLVGLEPTRVTEILKDRPSWLRDCRSVDVVNVLPTGNGGTLELLYMQLYAPTTLAPARDFWLLRYTSLLEDGSLVVCERSLSSTQGGPSMPPAQNFVRAEMLPSGYLIRPCEGGGSIIHIVDHMDLEPSSVPEVLRPLYESSAVLAQKTTMAALRQLRQIAQEVSPSTVTAWGRRPAALRALGHRLSRGFNEALNGFTDEGWTIMGNDGIDDVTILTNSSPSKMTDVTFADGFSSISSAVLCAKASMLLQNVPPAVLLRFLREHRSEWADSSIDAYSAGAAKANPSGLPASQIVGFGGQVILPLAHTIEHEEFLEMIKLENISHMDNNMMPHELFLLQLCSGVDENAVGSYAELIFAPIDASFGDDSPLLPSGFRIIPLDSRVDPPSPNRTLDLASALEVGPAGNRIPGNFSGNSGSMRSVMTIAFQFAYENHLQENVAAMARQYVRSIISSVQRVAMALSPSRLSFHDGLRSPPGTPEALTLARWICCSYRCYLGSELLKSGSHGGESLLKMLWHHSDAIMCCSLKALPVFTFANQAGLDMLETTFVALQDITLDKIFDDHGRKALYTEFPLIMQQGFTCLQGGVCVSSMGRPISYERAVAWKVLNEEDNTHCMAFMFVNWSFV